MKLKNRLIAAFFVITCVPLILAGVAFMGFSHVQMNSLKEKLGLNEIDYETMANTVQILNEATVDVYDELAITAEENPDVLMDTEYLDAINGKLENKSSYLIIRKGKSLYYAGNNEANRRLFRELPSFGATKYKTDGTYIGQDVKAYVKQVDVIFSDETEGSAFIITTIGGAIPEARACQGYDYCGAGDSGVYGSASQRVDLPGH